MPLTDTTVRNAKSADRPFSLADEKGLSLSVQPSGGKWWRFRYRFDGKAKMLSLGIYPDVGLKAARERRDAVRKQVAEGIDPGQHRKAVKAECKARSENTIEGVALEWVERKGVVWSASYRERILQRLVRDLFPVIGPRPIAEMKAMELLAVLRKIEARGAIETAHRARGDCGQVFRYAIATGRAERDIAADLVGALKPKQTKHFPSVTDPAKVAGLLRALDSYQGSFVVMSAMRLAPLLFVRPGELRHAEWADIDLDAAEWRYTVTKTKTAHIVPLATQAVAILTALKAVTGTGRYVFPGGRSNGRPMSDNAVLAAMRRSGIPADEMTGHGFRAMARTILDEVLGVRPDFIEHQLAHSVRDPNGRAYNRTAHLTERKKMMQAWADYLDKIKAGANVIPMNSAA